MRVLVATRRGQGGRPDDYCFTVDGELVTPVAPECCEPERCGCGRGFPGLESSRATTTAEVVDRRDLDTTSLRDIVAAALEREGWRRLFAATFERYVDEHVQEIVHIATSFPVGSVIRRDAVGYHRTSGSAS